MNALFTVSKLAVLQGGNDFSIRLHGFGHSALELAQLTATLVLFARVSLAVFV